MESGAEKSKSFLSIVVETLLKNKAYIYIFLGLFIRVVMLFYYYYIHILDPSRDWGDLTLNFESTWGGYPLITQLFLDLFRFLSFGFIEIMAFWGFFWDLIVCFLLYFVLKSFSIKKIYYAYGLFLLNGFFFLNNSFSIENCGYHLTDSIFFVFLFLSLIFCPKKEIYNKFLFYIFLAFSLGAKYYTLPAVGFFFIKFIIEKDWKEMKIFLISTIPILLFIIVIPTFLFPQISSGLLDWYNTGTGAIIPLFIRLIPIAIIFIVYTVVRLKSASKLEIIIISTIAMASFMIFSYPYVRWFQSIIFLGILNEKEFFTLHLNFKIIKREIKVDNHLLTFYLSFIGVILAVLFIIFVY
ncbi:MAG: hypothetical protein ACFFHD_15035 [Promethearchaeota archaeon]